MAAAKKLVQQALTMGILRGGFEKNLDKLRVVSAGEGTCVAELCISTEHTNPAGYLHGGLATTLVDVVSMLAFMTTTNGNMGASVDIRLTFLKSAKTEEEVLINAWTLKSTSTLAFLEANIVNKDTGKVLIKGSQTIHVAKTFPVLSINMHN